MVTAALGGIHAHVFLQMDHAERAATLDALIGRELRCVVGGNGAVSEDESNGGHVPRGGGDDARASSSPRSGWEKEGGTTTECGDWSGGGVQYRVECIASANPAADLGHLLLP